MKKIIIFFYDQKEGQVYQGRSYLNCIVLRRKKSSDIVSAADDLNQENDRLNSLLIPID